MSRISLEVMREAVDGGRSSRRKMIKGRRGERGWGGTARQGLRQGWSWASTIVILVLAPIGEKTDKQENSSFSTSPM